jgi:hypothetical protein
VIHQSEQDAQSIIGFPGNSHSKDDTFNRYCSQITIDLIVICATIVSLPPKEGGNKAPTGLLEVPNEIQADQMLYYWNTVRRTGPASLQVPLSPAPRRHRRLFYNPPTEKPCQLLWRTDLSWPSSSLKRFSDPAMGGANPITLTRDLSGIRPALGETITNNQAIK